MKEQSFEFNWKLGGSVEECLKARVDYISKKYPKKKFKGGYRCVEDFVLQNGVQFNKATSRRDSLWRMVQSRKYHYCEGYVRLKWQPKSVIRWAWGVNEGMEVFEPEEPPPFEDYFGVVFHHDYAIRSWEMKKGIHTGKGTLNLIRRTGYPLLRLSREELKEHLFPNGGNHE